MKPDEVLGNLRHETRFPCHGWAKDADNCIYLVFPFLRAIWERSESSPSVPLAVRDFVRMGYFQRCLFRILQVLGKIARSEELILSGEDREGAPMEDYLPVLEAEESLPIWIDCFYIYFRLLADRLTVALAPLVSRAPRSFPAQYKTLLDTANAGPLPSEWKLKVNADRFQRAISENSEWYYMLVGEKGATKKGIRDTVMHRLVEQVVVKEIDDDRSKGIRVCFEGVEKDVPDIDILSSIPKVIKSFCEVLSALPSEVWEDQNFHIADLTFRAPGGTWLAVTRFFPRVL